MNPDPGKVFPDPTFEKKPVPIVKKKPDPDPTLNKKTRIRILPNFGLTKYKKTNHM